MNTEVRKEGSAACGLIDAVHGKPGHQLIKRTGRQATLRMLSRALFNFDVCACPSATAVCRAIGRSGVGGISTASGAGLANWANLPGSAACPCGRERGGSGLLSRC